MSDQINLELLEALRRLVAFGRETRGRQSEAAWLNAQAIIAKAKAHD